MEPTHLKLTRTLKTITSSDVSLLVKNKIIQIVVILMLSIFSSCTDLNKDSDVIKLICDHTIFIEGEMIFKKDGTFSLVPQKPNDPTQLYEGTWTLGNCINCDNKDAEREIRIKFNNRGWITDDHSENGINYSGISTELHGYILKHSYKWNIRFDRKVTYNEFLNSDGERSVDNSSTWWRELK